VIVDQIDVSRAAILKTEDNPPILPNRDRPLPLPVTFERMQPKAWPVKIFEGLSGVQSGQNDPDPLHHVCGQQPPTVILVKLPQPFVAKAFDYSRGM
jgi:hypothetical protein